MVVFAALLMVVEMAVFAFAPLGNPSLLFGLFLVNRVLSGAAEASASGADEALAYDSLVAEGRADEWPRVLERLMRWQAAAFLLAMMLGATVYDARFVQSVLDTLRLPWKVTQEVTMRFPIYLTLGNALLALLATLNLREPAAAVATHGAAKAEKAVSARTTWRVTLATGRWILHTPLALGVILAGMCFDSIVRLFLTVASNYYRLIALPDAVFGLIGSGFAVIGFFAAGNRAAARITVEDCGELHTGRSHDDGRVGGGCVGLADLRTSLVGAPGCGDVAHSVFCLALSQQGCDRFATASDGAQLSRAGFQSGLRWRGPALRGTHAFARQTEPAGRSLREGARLAAVVFRRDCRAACRGVEQAATEGSERAIRANAERNFQMAEAKWPVCRGRGEGPMSIDLGLLPLTPQTGHCARAASQAVLKELLGKGLARRGGRWLCCGGRSSPMGIRLPPRLAETPRRCHRFGNFFQYLL